MAEADPAGHERLWDKGSLWTGSWGEGSCWKYRVGGGAGPGLGRSLWPSCRVGSGDSGGDRGGAARCGSLGVCKALVSGRALHPGLSCRGGGTHGVGVGELWDEVGRGRSL